MIIANAFKVDACICEQILLKSINWNNNKYVYTATKTQQAQLQMETKNELYFSCFSFLKRPFRITFLTKASWEWIITLSVEL